MSGDKVAHETISSCHIGFKGFLKAVFKILSDKVHRCIHPNITISSTLTRAWRGLEPTQTTYKCLYCGHLRRHRTIAKPQRLVIHLVLDHWNLEAMDQKQCHSDWIKQLHSSGLQTEWWHGVKKYLSTDQNVIDVSPGIHHSPYEVHSRIYECHHGYSVKEEQVSPNIMVILP